MSVADRWRNACSVLQTTDADGLHRIATAWDVVTAYLEPRTPQDCCFYAVDTGKSKLDTHTSAALRELLAADIPHASSSSSNFKSKTLTALYTYYIGKCISEFDVVYAEQVSTSDLRTTLASASHWFSCWLSPFQSGGIFDSFDEAELLTAMQSRLRAFVDRRFIESLRTYLQSLLGDEEPAGHLAKLQQFQLLGLDPTVRVVLVQVLRLEVSRKVRAVVEGIDLLSGEESVRLEERARPGLKHWLVESMERRAKMISLAAIGEGVGLEYGLDKALCHVRASQLFDLIAIYPDSAGALQDLSDSLGDQKLMVAKQLEESLRSRLLHPGAHTRDLVQMYVHMVRALRQVDESGVILSRVVSPLRKYLRERQDTIPVIVSSMLGDDPNFTLLKDELEQADMEEHDDASNKRRRKPRRSLQTRKTPKRIIARSAISDSDSSDEDWADPDWMPKPVEAGRNYRLSTSKDIISMLISIFDDRSGFIAALEKSMADQLIRVKGYRAMEEYRNNMILKKRFGERNMGKCDVMLGDVTDSRRIDTDVHSRIPGGPNLGMASRLHPLIVSRQFWPEFLTPPSANDFTLPPIFSAAQAQYSRAYAQSKAMRKLHWLNNLGTVEMDVELDSGQSISVECSLLQASTLEVISRVDQPKIITLTTVMDQLNLQQEQDARDALEFWTSAGLLQPIDGMADTFAIQTSLPVHAEEEI